ncbi:MAG TPA: thiamine pyrophosphate-dependent enzyme, partial [Hyphomicrobiaceae bacterium]|nr:thiamine pyrophosphate-dependent enzyme [Hyphomicrobiaceae bacterium]
TRARAYGMAGVKVDGNDAVAVDELATRLSGEVRSGAGPRLLHAKTYRWTGHTSTDAAAWRDPKEVEAAKAGCPIARLAATLAEQGMASSELAKIKAAAEAEMADARSAARSAPFPGVGIAFEDVQDIGATRGA